MSSEIWEEYYDRLAELVREHRTTLVFVNTRRLAERLARHLSDRLGDGGRDRPSRQPVEGAAAGRRDALEKWLAEGAGGHRLARARHRHRPRRSGLPDRARRTASRRCCSGSGRSGHTIVGTPKGRVFPTSRDDLVECIALLRSIRRGELDAVLPHDAPTRRARAADRRRDRVPATAPKTSCLRWCAGRGRIARCQRSQFDAVVAMLAEGFSTRRGRRGGADLP